MVQVGTDGRFEADPVEGTRGPGEPRGPGGPGEPGEPAATARSGALEREAVGSDLAEIMGRIVGGDRAAVFTLAARFEVELARTVRRIAASRGARLGAEEVGELVVEVAIELARLAPAWSPEGAPPWVWARHRVANIVDRHVGQWATPIDQPGIEHEVVDPPAAPGDEPPVLDVVAGLAGSHPLVALLHEAVGQVASPRDQVLFYETAVQVSLGDRSPAVTVGDLYGMRPEAVRQQTRRVRTRVRQLASDDPRFAALADLHLVA